MISDASVLSLTTLIFAYYSIGWKTPSSVSRSLNHIASLDAKISARYFAFVDDKPRVVWRFEHHLTDPPLSKKINRNVDFLVT